ncbi:hypothetical protein ENBRE01_0080 [Enteropsectra breve]|nr:hypothetical protein ENBRE01_0080 [Enteropsectra breve]
MGSERWQAWQESPDAQLFDQAGQLRRVEDDNKQQCLEELARYERETDPTYPIPHAMMDIQLTSMIPISKRTYPVPLKIRSAVLEELDRLQKEGIISPVRETAYASPAFAIAKKDKSIRLVVDYRALNEVTVKESYPFPNIIEELRSIPSSTIFSQIDLRQGYHQIAMSEEAQRVSAFVILNRHYEYLRVPFGLMNTPHVFQRTITRILGHLIYVRIFLDDILVISQSRDEHREHLREVLRLLKTNNVILNFDKSHFFESSVNYLGHIINSEGICPDTSRIESFRLASGTPRTKRQLLRLLGFINWFRPFIKRLSDRILPLTRQTKKEIPFNWTETEQKIVNSILRI